MIYYAKMQLQQGIATVIASGILGKQDLLDQTIGGQDCCQYYFAKSFVPFKVWDRRLNILSRQTCM